MISAIEDAVKLGADVINISMGMPSGHSETRGGIPQAVAQAVNAGTVVVSAAGNHGLNFSSDGSIDDVRGAWDDGTISHPHHLQTHLQLVPWTILQNLLINFGSRIDIPSNHPLTQVGAALPHWSLSQILLQ